MKIQQGDVVVVTGAASGIGYALVQRFAERGARIVMADVERPALENVFPGPPLPSEVYEPYEFAGIVLEGLDAGKLHIAPGRIPNVQARRRVDGLLADLEA